MGPVTAISFWQTKTVPLPYFDYNPSNFLLKRILKFICVLQANKTAKTFHYVLIKSINVTDERHETKMHMFCYPQSLRQKYKKLQKRRLILILSYINIFYISRLNFVYNCKDKTDSIISFKFLDKDKEIPSLLFL